MTVTIPLWLAWTLGISFFGLLTLILLTVTALAFLGAAFWTAIDNALFGERRGERQR